MAVPYQLHAEAHKEYIEAYEWYELKDKGLGDRFMSCVEKKLQQISLHPQFFGKRQSVFREAKVENFPTLLFMNFSNKRN